MLDGKVLDFYHFSEHIWSVANTCFGQDSEQAGGFAYCQARWSDDIIDKADGGAKEAS